MTPSPIEALAVTGLTGLDQLSEVSLWCWVRAEQTGDARFCGLARSLEAVGERWATDGGLDGQLFDRVNEIVKLRVPSVLAEQRAPAACSLARAMRDDILQELYLG